MRAHREITLVQALSWALALLGSGVALSWAFLLFFSDREQRASAFAVGGLTLAVWAAIHLTDRNHCHS